MDSLHSDDDQFSDDYDAWLFKSIDLYDILHVFSPPQPIRSLSAISDSSN